MVAMARAAGRPGPESIAAAVAQPLGVAAAMSATSLAGAVAAYAVVTTIAGLGLWWWLKRRLALDGLSWRDVAALVAVAAGTTAVAAAARAAADTWRIGAWPTMIAVGAATAGAGVSLALLTGAVRPEERRVLLRPRRRRREPVAPGR
jgi:hypothetical protein